jgi:hypothetical protein
VSARVLEALGPLLLSTLVAGAVLAFTPEHRTTVAHAYVLVVGVILVRLAVAAVGDALPGRGRSPFDDALLPPPPAEDRLPELERVQREVTLATVTAYDLHLRLLPALREIATTRLERNGRSANAETLGRWWELLRPDRPPPDDRFAPGLAHDDLRALVADLEKM